MPYCQQINKSLILCSCLVAALLLLISAQAGYAQVKESDHAEAISRINAREKAIFAPSSEDLKAAKEAGKGLSLPQTVRDNIEIAGQGYSDLKQGIKYVSKGISIAPQEISKAMDKLADGQGTGRLLFILGAVLFIYGIGLSLEFLTRRLTGKLRKKVEETHTGNLFRRLINDLILTGFEVVYFLVFFYGTINVMVLLAPEGMHIQLVAGSFLIPITMARIGILVLKFIFSPHSSESRIVPITDYAAKELTFWLSLTMILSPLLSRVIYTLSVMGLADETFQALFMLEMTVPTALLMILIWKNKNHLKKYILENSTDNKPGTAACWLADNWHLLASAYILLLVLLRQISLLQGREMLYALLMSLISVPAVILLDMTLFAALKNMIHRKNRLKKLNVPKLTISATSATYTPGCALCWERGWFFTCCRSGECPLISAPCFPKGH